MSSKPPAARPRAPAQQQQEHEQQDAAAAPLRVPREEAWRLLLEQLWVTLEPAVVCKLLCASSSMERLVHSTCRGRLSVKLKLHELHYPLPAVLSSWPPHLALGRWLAKHAVLLHSCIVASSSSSSSRHSITEENIAAGFAACVGRTPMPTTRQQAKALAPYAAITAAATASGSGRSSSTGQGLPLQSLTFWPFTDGTIVSSLAGSTQLTSLELLLDDSAAPGTRQALASLTGLQELRLHQASYLHVPALYHALAPALTALSALTFLDVGEFADNGANLQHFPTSLQQLRCKSHGAGLVLSHLQHLTRLMLVNCLVPLCFEGVELPPRLRELCVDTDSSDVSLQPVVGVQSLTRLELTMWVPSAGLLQDLVGMSQLQELHVAYSYFGLASQDSMAQAAHHLQALPLKSLDLVGSTLPPGFGGFTQLTRLELHPSRSSGGATAESVALFAAGLGDFPALQALHLISYSWAQRTQGASWAPVVSAVLQLPALRELCIKHVPFGASATSLAAATQLTRLELVECGLDECAKSALRAGLTQLSRADFKLVT